jgi:hypothetical protein
MAQATLVGQEIEDGQKLLARLAAANIDVAAAAWIKEAENPRWHFYIASKAIEELDRAEVRRRIDAEVRRPPDLWIDLFDVRVIGATEPLARDVMDYQSKHPKRIPVRFRGYRLGRLDVEAAFIYPPPSFLAAQTAPAANANTP